MSAQCHAVNNEGLVLEALKFDKNVDKLVYLQMAAEIKEIKKRNADMQKEFEDKKKKYDDDKKLFDVKKQKYNEDKSAFDNRGLFSGITDPGAEPSFDETEPKPVVLEDVPELDEQDLKWVEEPGKADNGQMVLMNPTSKGKSWLDFKEFCLQKFSECREAKEALDAAKRANPKQQTETYRKVPFVKTPSSSHLARCSKRNAKLHTHRRSKKSAQSTTS